MSQFQFTCSDPERMMQYRVTYSVRYETVIEVEEGENVDDAVSDVEIPETEKVMYVDQSFEVVDVEKV